MPFVNHVNKEQKIELEKMESEKILCAAIWYKELPLLRPDVLEPRGFQPYNLDHGVIFCGWRHHNCMYQKIAVTGLAESQSGESVQGFLTSKNRFVDRIEGNMIAINAGQAPKNSPGDRLFSEDLY